VLGVTAQSRMFTGPGREWAAAGVGSLPARAGSRVRCGAGSPGERRAAWARLPLGALPGARQRWLVARRHMRVPTEMAYSVVAGPRATSLAQMVRVAGPRWAIAASFETAKGAVGLDQYAVRSGPGWDRHSPLALLAHAYWTGRRAQAAGTAQALQKKRGGRRSPHRGRGVEAPDGPRRAAPPLGAGVGPHADA
jgi:hypothetical protein